MSFLSLTYALFLLSLLIVYWSVQKRQWKLWSLFAASLVFYASLDSGQNAPWSLYYIPLLLIFTFFNFRLGLEVGENATLRPHITNLEIQEEEWQTAQQDWNRRRLKLLWFGITINVFLLLGFKYIPFFLSTLGSWFNWSAAQTAATWTDNAVIAPLALSFFCFECIAYLIDVYRGAPATDEFLHFATYKFFFPKLLSGPITRYHALISQTKSLRFPTTERISEGLWLIACGAVKKALLADNLGIAVDLIFGNLQRAGSVDLWIATIAYGFQLYLDFSGYVDIARGSATLLGFTLPQNFNFPYFSTSIADFWRRWHITLGDWLRNYLYFPLGGSRLALHRTCLNLTIVMLIAGIWHGAAWGFIVWGGIHGLGLVLHRLTHALSQRPPIQTAEKAPGEQSEEAAAQTENLLQTLWNHPIGLLLAWFLTQFMVFFAWIFFRLPNLKDSFWVVQHLIGHSADAQFAQKVYVEAIGLGPWQISLILLAIAALMGFIYAAGQGLKLQLNWPVKVLLVPPLLYAVWILAPADSLPYIYFDF